MSTIAIWLSKVWLLLSLAAGTLTGTGAGMPALANSQAGTPAVCAAATGRLERVWAREQRVYDRLGRFFDRVDERLARGQALIDKARADGKDVSALQGALDAFTAAVKQAQPVFESGKGILSSHQGFDANGQVVDASKAIQTVMDMRAKLQEIKQIILPPARALREAIRTFRQANQPAATPTP